MRRLHIAKFLCVCVCVCFRKEDAALDTYLIAENLDLTRSSVYELVGSRAKVIGVDLYVQRKPLHSLLRGEVCAQGVNANVHLGEET